MVKGLAGEIQARRPAREGPDSVCAGGGPCPFAKAGGGRGGGRVAGRGITLKGRSHTHRGGANSEEASGLQSG